MRLVRAACGRALLLAFAAAGGCQQLSTAGGGRPDTFAVGDNAIGEPCAVVSGGIAGGAPEPYELHRVQCGNWEQPSARITELTSSAAPPMALATQSWWRTRLDASAACDEARATQILDGTSAVALDCILRQGSWAYQALVVQQGGKTFLAESVPAAMPAVEQAIDVLSGRLPVDAAARTTEVSPELARLQARLATARYSVGDLQAYRKLLQAAQADNFAGKHAQAEARYREALELQQRSGLAETDALAFLTMHLAVEVSNQERFEEAEALFQRAEAMLDQSLDPTMEPMFTSYWAIHQANQRHHAEAVKLARQATEQRLQLAGIDAATGYAGIAAAFSPALGGDVDLPFSRNQMLMDVVQSKYIEAAALVEQGEYAKATEVLDEAAAITVQEPRVPRHRLAKIRMKQAEIAEREGALDHAELDLKRAIAIQQRTAVDSREEGRMWLALGGVRAHSGQAEEALAAFRNGFSILAKDTAPLRFSEIEPFADLVFAEARRNPARRAQLFAELFDVAQLVRTPAIAQSIALLAARLAAGNEAAGKAIRALEDARRQRDAVVRALAAAEQEAGAVAVDTTALERTLAAVNQSIESLERQVQAAAPGYNRLIERPAAADSVKAVLAGDEALTQIVVGPERSLAFLVDAEGVEAYAVDLGEAKTARIVESLRAPFTGTSIGRFDLAAAHQLYRTLFAPVDARLQRAKRVVAVPSGPLLSLPYGLLVVDPPPEQTPPRYDQVAWMARRQALSVSPSVQSLVGLRERVEPSRARQPLLGWGAFVANRDVPKVLAERRLAPDLPDTCRQKMAEIVGFEPLPGTEQELRAVASVLGVPDSALRLGEQFTEAAVRGTDLADYRVLYFATHGFLPHEARECRAVPALAEPGLIASHPGAGTNPEADGILLASEVIGLSLDADLVVLSACDTGGHGAGGESLSGLARAFFYAGARSLLVTHWQIADEQTAALMSRTFTALSKGGLSQAEALREGQLALIADRRTAHPIFWAAFTLIGGDRATPRPTATVGGPDS